MGVVDDWQLIMWLFAVSAFYYRLPVSLGPANAVDRTMCERLRPAMLSHVDFSKQLIAFPKAAPDLRIEALQSVSGILKGIAAMLKLE